MQKMQQQSQKMALSNEMLVEKVNQMSRINGSEESEGVYSPGQGEFFIMPESCMATSLFPLGIDPPECKKVLQALIKRHAGLPPSC